MWSMIGWTAWAGAACLALTFAYGCRKYAAAGQGFSPATGVQTFYWWIITVVFLLTPLNKLHIIWLVPLGFFGALFIALGGIPLVSSSVLLATRAFLGLVLIGTSRQDTQPEGREENLGKTEFIKSLLRQRLEAAGVFEEWRDRFDQLTVMVLMGTPEATIVAIVERFTELRRRAGSTDEAIFTEISRQRNAAGPGGPLPTPLTLTDYVSYRVGYEHGEAEVELTDELLGDFVRQSLAYFGSE